MYNIIYVMERSRTDRPKKIKNGNTIKTPAATASTGYGKAGIQENSGAIG